MSDRELLELAAKAAGYAVKIVEERGRPFPVGVWAERSDRIYWNPLAEDGDALRLAVKLGLWVFCPEDEDPTVVVQLGGDTLDMENAEADPYAATRRAIVRAAAAMAKGGEL